MLGAKTFSSMFHVNRALLFALGTTRRKSIALLGVRWTMSLMSSASTGYIAAKDIHLKIMS